MIDTDVKIRLKLMGRKPRLEDLIAFLETRYVIVPTSEFLANDNREGVHIFLTLIRRTEVEAVQR